MEMEPLSDPQVVEAWGSQSVQNAQLACDENNGFEPNGACACVAPCACVSCRVVSASASMLSAKNHT
eukprot:3775815-Alexandrium_andersonii.AAC.1